MGQDLWFEMISSAASGRSMSESIYMMPQMPQKLYSRVEEKLSNETQRDIRMTSLITYKLGKIA